MLQTMLLGARVKFGKISSFTGLNGTIVTVRLCPQPDGYKSGQPVAYDIVVDDTGEIAVDMYAHHFRVIELPPAPGTVALAKVLGSGT